MEAAMAEIESTTPPTPIPTSLNITALAKRLDVSRRTIQRRMAKGWTPPATAPKAKPVRQQVRHVSQSDVAPDAAPDAPRGAPLAAPLAASPGHAVAAATLVAALALATCSAAFSINGLTSIFAGAFWPVIGLGVAFEIGKLSAVAWLGKRFRAGTVFRFALVALVAVLMALNSVGIYGYLARAHLQSALAGDLQAGRQAADVDARIGVQAGVVADLDRRIAQVDAAVERTAEHGRGKAAMALAEEQRKNRADLVANRTTEAGKLANLKVEKAAIDGERKAVEADLGPVRYLATLLGSTDEQTMLWFILVVALMLDPAAVLLLLAATRANLS
jgi:hypothetical protein